MDGNHTVFGELARTLGTTEPALCLLTSLLVGYPLGLVHRYALYGAKPTYQHIFFVLTGIAIGYFNYGWEVLHSSLTIIGVYTILWVAEGSLLSVFLTIGFTMTYLIVGYYVTSTHVAQIKWTMAQCVLTLRLIGLVFDVYDGKRPQEKPRKAAALDTTPTLLEVAAHTYFPASFLVGPQFSMRRYLDFTSGMFFQRALPQSLWPGFKRGIIGLLYLAVYQVGIIYFPTEYLLSAEFEKQPFYKCCFFLALWGKIILYKYVACWLMAEGVCILTGLAYNGTDENKQVRWDGCANIKLKVYENTTKFEHIIMSFNVNTNNWAAEYVYKRLKVVGNRLVSQMVTLLFLALWHGVHSGYYMCFFLEFIVTYMEKDLGNILNKNQTLSSIFNKKILQSVIWIVQKFITLVVMGYALVPFVLLSYKSWVHVYKSVHFFGHIIFLSWPICSPLVKYILCPKVSLHRPNNTNSNMITTLNHETKIQSSPKSKKL